MDHSLKDIRKDKELTQAKAAELLGVSLRSCKSYENDLVKSGSLKYRYMVDTLSQYNTIDENHGILPVDGIIKKCEPVFDQYGLSYVYLFGSYAKGKASEKSDIDLLVSSEIKGLRFYGFVESLKNVLHKNVDVLDVRQLNSNPELLNEILKDGIRIYG